jgi:hypothetical protein
MLSSLYLKMQKNNLKSKMGIKQRRTEEETVLCKLKLLH